MHSYGTEGSSLLWNDDRGRKQRNRYSRLSAFLIFFFPALGGLLFGYDIGATSAVIIQLQSKDHSGVVWYSVVKGSSVLIGTITSVSMFGAMLGCLVCFRFADDLGRRRLLLVAGVLYFVGSILENISGISSFGATLGITILIFGRLIYGAGFGFAMQGAPAYIGEMAPAEIRGMMVSMKEAMIVVGMLLGYSIGYAYSNVAGGWRATFGWASIVALAMFGGMYYLPYSARWLALKGRTNEAKNALMFVTPELPASEVDAIRELALRTSTYSTQTSLWDDYRMLSAPSVYPALVTGVGLVIFQQITGQPSVLYYADTIFADVGVDNIASIAISLFKLVATLLSTFMVDDYGRKLLLNIGCTLMLIALFVLGTCFLFPYDSTAVCNEYTTTDDCPGDCLWKDSCDSSCDSSGYDDSDCECCGATGITVQKSIILTALFVYIGGYQVGFGPIVWLLISELFPLEVRGKAVSIAVITNFLFNSLMTFIFPVELEYIGAPATFYLYAVVLIGSIYFIYTQVPETKGLTLEEIEEYFLRASRVRDGMRGGNFSAEEESIKREANKMEPVL